MTKKRGTKSASGSDGSEPAQSAQWEDVRRWRALLQQAALNPRGRKTVDTVSDGGEGNPALASLEQEWLALTANRDELDWLNDRERDEINAGSVLGAINLFVQMGVYPPPELLLTLTHAYQRYLQAAGSASAEETFFGRPKPKAGNHARQEAARMREVLLAHELAAAKQPNESDEAALERIMLARNIKGSVDSTLRRLRKHWKRAGGQLQK